MSYFDFDSIEIKDKKMQEILHMARQMADTQASVLIAGDPGVGKSSLAKYIHQKGKKGTVITLDCRKTKADFDFRSISCGTLILEEIDGACEDLQANLIQFLEEADKKPRFISTSRRELKSLVKQNQFRQDLFYKLAVIHLEIPSLQNRKVDLIKICDFILDVSQIMHAKSGLHLSAEAFGRLSSWKWPGNIRELENVIERAVILTKGNEIDASSIVFESLACDQISDFAPGMPLSAVEKRLILQTLELTAQNRTRAAQILGISIRTLRNKLNEYKTDFKQEEGVA